MLNTLAEKAACDSKKKKKEYSEAVVNTKECEKKPKEEKDMRGTYAKINLVKNKMRSAGCKNVMVSVDDLDEFVNPDLVQKALDAGSDFIQKNPIGKALGNVVKPWKSTDGGSNRKSATKQSQQELINKNVK